MIANQGSLLCRDVYETINDGGTYEQTKNYTMQRRRTRKLQNV